MLKRAEAAEILGKSVSTLRRLERSELPPVVDENGVHLQSEQRILEFKIQQTSARGGSDSVRASGEDRLLLLRAANGAPLLPVFRSSDAARAEARGGRTGGNRSEA